METRQIVRAETMARRKKNGELIGDGKPITVRFPPVIEQAVMNAAEQEGLSLPIWLRRLAILEIRKVRRGKQGN